MPVLSVVRFSRHDIRARSVDLSVGILGSVERSLPSSPHRLETQVREASGCFRGTRSPGLKAVHSLH